MELTPNESRILETIIARTQAGNPPTFEDIRAEHYGTRKNTLPTVKRAINSLEEKGLINVTFSVTRTAEVATPTKEDTEAGTP